MQKIECEFKFAKLDIFWEIKKDSGCTCKFWKVKIMALLSNIFDGA